mgnify:CR=1 FL=1
MEALKSFMKRVKWDSIIISILTIAVGILCVAMPDRAGDVLCIVFGASLIAMSVTLFARFFGSKGFFGEHLLILAMIMLVLGIFCLIYPVSIQNILTVLFGLFIVIDSASSLNNSVYCAKARVKGWSVLFILSLLRIGLGVAVMFSNFDTVMIFAGCSLIFDGLTRFILTLVYSRKIKKAKKQIQSVKDDVIDI